LSSISEAYVDPEEKELDPALLDASAIERLPNPSGYRLLVLPAKQKTKSDGGIELLQATAQRESLATVAAWVVKMGPLCYKDDSRFHGIPWCSEQQWILIGRYAGTRFKLNFEGDENPQEVRIINDDEVIGTILNPDDIVSMST
tara:strand:- start:3282 stop:3713 length:432 start_codon:yes stop_codon:yes gene_type:complete